MQRIDDVGWQALVKQKSEDVVAVVSGSLKPYFYFILRTSTAADCLQERVEALCVVRDGEYICQDFTFRADDEAVVLVLGHVNSYANHENTSDVFI